MSTVWKIIRWLLQRWLHKTDPKVSDEKIDKAVAAGAAGIDDVNRILDDELRNRPGNPG